jgi:hypothetical protein
MQQLLLPAQAQSLVTVRFQRIADMPKIVALALVSHSKPKATALSQTLKKQQELLNLEKKNYQVAQQKYKTLQQKQKFLVQRHKTLTVKRPTLIENYTEVIQHLLRTRTIEAFEVDSRKRIVITTTPLLIKKPHWKRAKNAGKYQIRINFSQQDFKAGIGILNITQAYAHYQSPTISHTEPCWGNIAGDIELEFQTGDIYQLVLDLIDYIKSPNDQAGYIHLPKKEKDTGWEQFFARAEKRPPGFCFKKYRKKTKTAPIHLQDSLESVAFWTFDQTSATRSIQYQAIDPRYFSAAETSTHQSPRQQLSPRGSEILHALHELGLISEAAERFMRSIPPTCGEIHLEQADRELAFIVIMGEDERRRTPDEDMRHAPPLRQTQRWGVNRMDMTDTGWRNLDQRHRVIYRFGPSREQRERDFSPYAHYSREESARQERRDRMARSTGAVPQTMRRITADDIRDGINIDY